jgi:hypothetical protein
MATSIGKLAVFLSANTAGFTSGLDKAGASVAQFAGGLTRTASMVGGFAAAIAGAAGVAGIGALTKQAMSTIDSTAKLADRINATTEELVGLRHAADLAGAGGDALDKGLETMVRRLGEAAQGTGEAKRGLETIGMTAKDLAGLSAGEQFIKIAEGIKGIEDPTLKAAAAYQIFGRSGQVLINTLNEGADGLRAAREEVDATGQAFSRLDAAKVEAANDSLTRVGEAFTTIGQNLAINLAPFIQYVADKFASFAKTGIFSSGSIARGLEMVTSAVATVADYLQLPIATFKLLQAAATKAIQFIVKGMEKVFAAMAAVREAIGLTAHKFRAAQADAAGWAAELGDSAYDSFVQAGQAMDDFSKGANSKAVTAFFENLRADSDAAAQGIADAAKHRAALAEAAALAAPTEAFTKAEDAIAGLQQQLDLVGKTKREAELYKLALAGANEEQLKIADGILAAIDAQQKQVDLIADGVKLAEKFESPIAEFERQVDALTAAFKAGAITVDAMDTATQKLSEELDKKLAGDVKDTGEFQQVSLSRAALGGTNAGPDPARDQPKAKQIDVMIDVLKEIKDQGRVARAG